MNKTEQIEDILDREIRPALNRDGGDIDIDPELNAFAKRILEN